MTDLFGAMEWWCEHWRGMPEFVQADLEPFASVTIRFGSDDDLEHFATLIGRDIPRDTRETYSIWFPGVERERWDSASWISIPAQLRFPVYIISKGRWESRLTARALTKIGVPYRIVVEPQEADAYAAHIDRAQILVLPFQNLGQGSIPARNWVWEHSISEGHRRHWILDDNISIFLRMNRNSKAPVASGMIFKAAEDHVERYENVALAGFNYDTFAPRRVKQPPFSLNTRIYSCILIKNDLPYRWRGRYNEDTDLSLRALKAGECTILYNAFQAKKTQTMTMRGGNTDELYADDGRLKMAQSLVDQHPDVCRISWKWGRWQHHVDYSPFKRNGLRYCRGVAIPDGVDEYTMRRIDGAEWNQNRVAEKELKWATFATTRSS